MKIYHLSLLLLSINGMAQKNKEASSLENEMWAIGRGDIASNSGETYEFFKNGDALLTAYYSGGGYYKNELKGKYIYIPEKEEVYLSYREQDRRGLTGNIPKKQCVKLATSPDSARHEVRFYADWEKRGQQYFPVGKPNIRSFSARAPIIGRKVDTYMEDGYSLYVPRIKTPHPKPPEGITVIDADAIDTRDSFSRTKKRTSKPIDK